MTEEELRGIPCRTWAQRLDAAENVCELAEQYGFSQLSVAVAAWRQSKPRHRPTASVAEHVRQVARLMLERDELRRQLEEMKADRDRLAALVIELTLGETKGN